MHINQIKEACRRAADLQAEASGTRGRYPHLTYEDGLMAALDWVCGNSEEDPTWHHWDGPTEFNPEQK